MKIYCLPTLIKKISCHRTVDPFLYVNSYVGKDWEDHVSTYPLSLWKNDYMELKLNYWRSGKIHSYYNNYSTIHTKVLSGKMISTMFIKPDIDILVKLEKDDHHTFHPFSQSSLKSLEHSAHLQLYYFHHLY